MVQYGFRWYRWIAILTTKRHPFVLCVSTLIVLLDNLPHVFSTCLIQHLSYPAIFGFQGSVMFPNIVLHCFISFPHLFNFDKAQETFSSQGAQGLHSCLPRLAAGNHRMDGGSTGMFFWCHQLLCFYSWAKKNTERLSKTTNYPYSFGREKPLEAF